MHREMMEQAQADRGRGKAVAEDQHDILDEWATLDPHTDLDSYADGSFQAVRTLWRRVGGHVDVEGLLATDDVEGVNEDIERRHDDILASTSQPLVAEIGSLGSTTSQCVNHPSSSRFAGPTAVDSRGLEPHDSATLGSLACTVDVRGTGGSSQGTVHRAAVHRAGQRRNDSMDERADQAVEHRAQHRERVQQVAEQLLERPGVRQSVVQTVDWRADVVAEDLMGHRVDQKVGDSTECRLYENAHPRDKDDVRPIVVQTVEQRVGKGLAGTVEQRVDQRVHPCAPLAADRWVEQRVEQRVEVRVDVNVEQQVDQGRSDIARERVSDRIDESVVRDEGVVMAEDGMKDRTEETGKDPPQESRARDITLTRGSFYGIPSPSPSAAQSSQGVDLGVHCMSLAHRVAAQERASGGGRGALDSVSSKAMQGGGRSLSETGDVAEGIATGVGVAVGVHTRSRAASREMRKTSTRVLDDDPDENDDGNTSDEMSGSDYAEETRMRGQDEAGDDDNFDDTSDMAD
ncbi:hypothetical protein CBR_g34411 [Chara braunii]|uniref:Uncharacterized protein n=1 Tax=Chara braunii TaxID=69332 RepID=A0A388LIH2_CHABU|nr:hypothetical protein CBR_g34411 [Chara braunii]|eukprot:GBG82130.1 hypothetical protein CBR_g34411 [Chara braunii]